MAEAKQYSTHVQRRRLPVGIQSFKVIRQEDMVYVDKTDLVWQLVNEGYKYSYLSRPRRFGKSVLVDTLQTYLEGRKDMFDGLKIMDIETEWRSYPVIRLDMSRGGATANAIRSYLNNHFSEYEQKYDLQPSPTDSLADRLHAIITKAYHTSGAQVAILIDEYDSPLQHSWHSVEHEECTAVYREVFAILKADDEYEKLVFITGITKFTQISLFSALNNLYNISFEPEYASICGITQNEVIEQFEPELKLMATNNGWTVEETITQLKAFYDGYHFSHKNMVDIFNPFSLINALKCQELKNFWASSGSSSLLPKFVNDMDISLGDFEKCSILGSVLETSDVTGGGPELFLYQSGYLTIKGYQKGVYFLGFPNHEVKQALYETVLPALTMRKSGDIQSVQANLYYSLCIGDTDKAKKALKALIADVPYSNKRLASMNMEERYRLIISTILNAIGCRVEVEHMLATGRIDLIARTDEYTYIMELKLTNNGGIKAATEQILNKRYLEPFKADKRRVIGLAVELDSNGNGLIDWNVIQ